MGYKAGEGLGREAKGIVKPVEAKMRAKNMGMGFGTRQDDEVPQREASPLKVNPGLISTSLIKLVHDGGLLHL